MPFKRYQKARWSFVLGNLSGSNAFITVSAILTAGTTPSGICCAGKVKTGANALCIVPEPYVGSAIPHRLQSLAPGIMLPGNLCAQYHLLASFICFRLASEHTVTLNQILVCAFQ